MARILPAAGLALVSAVTARAADAPAAALPLAPAHEVTDVLERFVSWLHHFFPNIDDGLFHWIACGLIVVATMLLRRFVTNIIFNRLKKLAEKTETTLDDKLFPALEEPVAALVLVLGVFAALTALQLSEQVDHLIAVTAMVAMLAVILWGFINAGGAILTHFEEIAHERHMTVATFMPLIKKTLYAITVVVGLLLIADSVGLKIGVFLTSLGIGGLAFALAAQDTIANLFGSFVVVVDQPFKVGDNVRIGAVEGVVEDIGLRSTKLRPPGKNLVILPNKTVANEAIVNNSRFVQRRVEQVIGLTYDTTAEQMDAIVGEFRRIILAEPEVDPASVLVYFRDYGASSLDIWVVYLTRDPNLEKHLAVRQRINLAMMRAVAAHGLSFAFPTQTMHLDGPVAKALVEKKR
jgi:MscS family membrane protein